MAEIEKEPKEEMIAGVRKWQAESACDAILRAEEVKLQPKLFNAAKIVLQRRYEAIQKAKAKLGQTPNSS